MYGAARRIAPQSLSFDPAAFRLASAMRIPEMRTACFLAICLAFSPALRAAGFETARVKVSIPGAGASFWTLRSKTGPAALDISPPVFSIGGTRRTHARLFS
jgi:hypothetical protein